MKTATPAATITRPVSPHDRFGMVRRGAYGPAVRRIQEDLAARGYSIDVDSEFGPKTESAVRNLQARAGIEVDGIVGPDTWRVLEGPPIATFGRVTQILRAAHGYLGQQEKRGNMGFRESLFDKAMRAIGFRDGDPWCSHYAERVYTDGYADDPAALALIARLWSGSGKRTVDNFLRERADLVHDEPRPGAVMVIRLAGWTSHVGIVDEKGFRPGRAFRTYEGNTNDGGGREGYIVARHVRPWPGTSRTRYRGFIGPI